jgi:hypothetical protein
MRGKIMPQGTDEDLIMEIDRRLKPTGQASKQYGAFTIYKEVGHNYTDTKCNRDHFNI